MSQERKQASARAAPTDASAQYGGCEPASVTRITKDVPKTNVAAWCMNHEWPDGSWVTSKRA